MKKKWVLNNPEMNSFFTHLWEKIDTLSINYIHDYDNIILFLEGLENLDCYNEKEKLEYIIFYFEYKIKIKMLTKLADYLSLNTGFSLSYEEYQNLIFNFFKDVY